MLKIEYHTQFKKDYKTVLKRGCNPELIVEVIELLANGYKLPPKYKDHNLTPSRNYKRVRECHLQPDWLLIYQIDMENSTLRLIRTGSHSDLF